MTAKEATKLAEENKVEMVDFKFCDLLGTWQHFTIPISEFDEAIFQEGLGFDGSSIRGWKAINASDMLVVPDAATARMDPFMERPTLSLICDIEDPLTRERYDRDPRNIARRGVEFLCSTGLADTAFFGPEPEFFIFDSARFVTRQNMGYYEVDSCEAVWNTDEDGGQNLGYKVRSKEGYIPCSPTDQFQDLRTEMCRADRQRERARSVECSTRRPTSIRGSLNQRMGAAEEWEPILPPRAEPSRNRLIFNVFSPESELWLSGAL